MSVWDNRPIDAPPPCGEPRFEFDRELDRRPYIPRLGSESEDLDAAKTASAAKADPGTNLCVSCVHVDVCSILTAARVIMPEGGFEMSMCAMFFPTPKESEPT
jgi:hypothetical protein